jgi:hypothetical protein
MVLLPVAVSPSVFLICLNPSGHGFFLFFPEDFFSVDGQAEKIHWLSTTVTAVLRKKTMKV